MKITTIILILIWTCPLISYSQEDSKQDLDTSNDAKSLMLSYYDEGFEPFLKGNWYTSIEMKFAKRDQTNDVEALENIIYGETDELNIGLTAGYYFSDNFAAGMGFNYERQKLSGYSHGLTLLSKNDTVSKNSQTDHYTISPRLRSSIPLSGNKRINIYIDLGASVGFGNSVSSEINNNGRISELNADNFSLGVGMSPGVTFFVMQNFAIELGLNILEYSYESTTAQRDDLPLSKDVSQGIDFNLSLSRLNVALAYYFIKK